MTHCDNEIIQVIIYLQYYHFDPISMIKRTMKNVPRTKVPLDDTNLSSEG